MTKKQKLKIVDEAIRLIEIGKENFACYTLNNGMVSSITYNKYSANLRFRHSFKDMFLETDDGYKSTFSDGDNYGLDYSSETELGKRTRLIALELFKCMIEDGSI